MAQSNDAGTTDRLAGIFKAYDVRGTVPDQLDAPVAYAIGAAFARFAQAASRRTAGGAGAPAVGDGSSASVQPTATGEPPPRILVGRDARSSGPTLAGALAAGAISAGPRVVDLGLCSTDMS